MILVSLLGLVLCAEPASAPPASDLALVNSAIATTSAFLEPEPPAPGAIQINLADSVVRALTENGQSLAAQESVNEQAARVGQAKSALYPQISASSTYAYVEGLPTDVYEGGLGGIIGFIGVDIEAEKGLWTNTVELQQVLFSGGRIRNAIAAASALKTAQEWQREVTLDDLEYQTKQAYYDVLLTRALLQVADESIGVFERHAEDARKMQEAGMVSRFEWTRAETELGNRRAQRESAQTAATLARLNLLRLLALPQDTELALAATLEAAPPAGTLDELIAQAHEKRAEVRALDAAMRAADARIAVARGEFLPSAGASIRYDELDGGTSIQPEGLTLGVGVQWDVFTGKRRKEQVREAEAQSRGLKHQRSTLLDAVELDVRQAHARMQSALAEIEAEQGTVALGQEGLRLAELRFREGAGTASETLDAELAVTAARTNLVQALRDYAVAIAALERAAGISIVTRDTPEAPKPSGAGEEAAD